MVKQLSSAKSQTETCTTHNKPLILIKVDCSQVLLGDAFLIDTCYEQRIQDVHYPLEDTKDKLKSINLKQSERGDGCADEGKQSAL